MEAEAIQKAPRAQHGPVAGEVSAQRGLHEQDDRHGKEQQREVGEERSADAPEPPKCGTDKPAGGVGGEHAAHAHVLLPWPAFERVEGDPDPDAA